MELWAKILIVILCVLILMFIIFEYTETHIGYYFTGNIVITDDISIDELAKPVEKIILIHTSILPMFNAKYCSHWGIVAEAAGNFYYITTTRYNGLLIYRVIKTTDNRFYVKAKQYYLAIIREYEPKSKNLRIYDIALDNINFMLKRSYSIFSNSCHHITEYAIKKFAKNPIVSDVFSLKGINELKMIISDLLNGPSIYM